jgi:hypothetical protein
LGEQLPEESSVAVTASEVAAAPQHQGLVEGGLEAVVPLLDVTVLVALAGLNRLPAEAVVPQQGLVASLEHVGVGPRLHRRRQPVGAMHLGYAAQLPQGVLQALAEALQTLRETDRARLPIRVGEHEVVNQVREGTAGNRHPQFIAVRKVRSGQPAGVVDLSEEDLLGWALLSPPPLDPSLQGPQLAVAETAGILPLQSLEDGLGFQARVEGQLFLQLGPDLDEGVGSRPPGVLHAYLARQLAQPPVLACGLLVHAGLGRRPPLGLLLVIEAEQAADLLIGDPHLEPPFSWGSR